MKLTERIVFLFSVFVMLTVAACTVQAFPVSSTTQTPSASNDSASGKTVLSDSPVSLRAKIELARLEAGSDGFVRRGPFVICLMESLSKVESFVDTKLFSDVNTDDDYFFHAHSARKRGYMNGYTDGTFRGEEKLSRQQIAKTLGVLLMAEGVAKEEEIPSFSEALNYLETQCKDADLIIRSAVVPVYILVRAKIMLPETTDRLFNPERYLALDETREILWKVYEKIFEQSQF